MKFTLRTLGIAVAAVAVAMAVLLNPTTKVAAVVVNGVLCAVVVAACFAVASRQPARSLCLGFAIACTWALAIDELGRREIIGPVVFTGAVVTMMEEVLPPIPPMRGEPGSWLYFRSGGRFPIERFKVGDAGTTDGTVGFMTMEDAHRVGLFEQIGPLESLPHSDSIPNSRARSAICRSVLASFVGLVGGVLSYAVRRRGDLRTASGSGAEP